MRTENCGDDVWDNAIGPAKIQVQNGVPHVLDGVDSAYVAFKQLPVLHQSSRFHIVDICKLKHRFTIYLSIYR